MQATPEPQVLADVLHSARQLTLFYLQHADDLDKTRSFTVGGFKTNSLAWIVAHLAWAEDHLILQGVGGERAGKDWFRYFSIHSQQPEASQYPPYDETLDTFHQTHQKALNLLRELPPDALDVPNQVGLKFDAGDSKRIVIHHCIRHEGMHCGHIGWLLRMHGRKVI